MDEGLVDFIYKGRLIAQKVRMKNRSQIAPSCFGGPVKLVDLSPRVAWVGI